MKIKNQVAKFNPFEIERARDKLARLHDITKLKALYKGNLPEIDDKNTNVFWNEKFEDKELLDEQDAMTREKITYIAKAIPQNTKRLLDIAIGQGYLEQKLKHMHQQYQLFGIDISEIAIQRAKKNFKGKFIVGDVLELESYYKKEHFDCITALEIIEHIQPSKILGFLKQVHSLLNDNGVFIISTPLNEGLEHKKENPSGHVRSYTPAILRTEFEITGFNSVDIKTHYAFRNLYTIKKAITKMLPHHWEPNNIIIVAQKR